MKLIGLWGALSLLALGCTTSQVISDDSTIGLTSTALNDSSLTVFLLERDIPANIERLGIVTITSGASINVDKPVKEELKKRCQAMGANGAYRIADGFYPRSGIYPYLVFKYRK